MYIRHTVILFRPQIWHELLSRFGREIRKPDPRAKFRGSLVDDKMFAIDVKEWQLANLVEETRKRRLSERGEVGQSNGRKTEISRGKA